MPQRLSSPLVLVDSQAGVVGETGTVTTIAPDGTFTVVRFVNKRMEPAERSGRLDPGAMDRLARALSSELTADMPQKIGSGTANPHRIRLGYGSASIEAVIPRELEPGDEPQLASQDAKSPTVRVLRIRNLVQQLVSHEAR
jgi:hypothetical protein